MGLINCFKPAKVRFWSWIMAMKFRSRNYNDVAYYGNKTLAVDGEMGVPNADSVIESFIRVGSS